jgi:hypothetical protein
MFFYQDFSSERETLTFFNANIYISTFNYFSTYLSLHNNFLVTLVYYV